MKLKRIFKWTGIVIGTLLLLAIAAVFVAYWRSSSGCESLTAAGGETMQAIIYCDYGGPEVLRLAEIAKPVPKDDQVLVKVRAAAVNPYDWHFMRGEPYLMRLGAGLRKPQNSRFGVDFAGTVETVGKNVTRLKPGDAVFGGRTGAFAQYLAIAERSVTLKPENISFEQAGGIQIAGMTALQGLRTKGELQSGQSVLINGASGGVGTFAVQIAKALGAHVTGVCSTRNVEMVRGLGADRVIDYKNEDFTQGAERYDLILDMVGNRSLRECRRVLKPEGRYVMIGGKKGRWIRPMDRALRAMLFSLFVEQEMGMMVSEFNRDDLDFLRDLMAAGKLTPVLDRTYPLAQAAEAIRYLEEGHARGKVVLVVE